MQAFANIEMNFDFLFRRVSLTFVLLANIVILNYCDRALPINLNLIHKLPEAAISCIAGFVAKTLQKKLHCPKCCSVLGSQDKNVPCSPFLQLKDRAHLYKLSQSIITICTETEKCFQRMLKISGGKLPHDKGLVQLL